MDLATLGLTVDASGGIRAMSDFERAALHTSAKVEQSAARTSTAYSNWWDRALRGQEREHERVQKALARADTRAALEAQKEANNRAKAQMQADREAERSARQLASAKAREERETARQSAAETREWIRAQLQADRDAARSAERLARDRKKAGEESMRNALKRIDDEKKAKDKANRESAKDLERQNQLKLQAELSAYREQDRMNRNAAKVAERSARERASEERRANREIEKAARDTARAQERASREAAQEARRQARIKQQAEEESAKRSRDAWATIKRTLFLAAGGIGLRELIEYADMYKLIGARIALVTKSEQEHAAVQEAVYQVAQRSRSGYEETGELYSRIAKATEKLRRSQQDVLTVTEAINQSYIASGRSQQEIIGSTRQLTQALASNRLAGDELRSVLENAPRLAQAIATGMNVSVGDLRRLGREGKLTSEQVFKAILSQSTAIQKEFGIIPVTIHQAYTVMSNTFIRFLGLMDKATGSSNAVAKSIIYLSNHLPALVAMVVALGTAWAVYSTIMAIAELRTRIIAGESIINGIFKLIKMVRELGMVGAIAEAGLGGLAGAAALIIGLTAGWIAYTQIMKKMKEATDAANTDLLKQMNAAGDTANATEKLSKEERNRHIENLKMVATAKAAIELARLEGMAQEKLRINYEAANKVIEARGKFKGGILNETLNAIEEERVLRLTEMRVKHEVEETRQLDTTRRVLSQTQTLLSLQGVAHDKMKIDFEAINAMIEARRDLEKDSVVLNDRLIRIETERKQKIEETLQTIIRTYQQSFAQVASGFLDNILTNGVTSFKDTFAELFNSIKSMYAKMISDMLSRKFMESFGNKFGARLSRLFGDTGKLNESPLDASALALSNSATALSTAASALSGAAGVIKGQKVTATTTNTIPEIKVEPKSGFWDAIAKYAGPAISGFFIGRGIGGMTTNRALGTLGGAASGALTGAMIAGPIGAAVGGIAGAIGGFFGSKAKRDQERHERNDIIKGNSARLFELRQSMQENLMSGRNLAKALIVTETAVKKLASKDVISIHSISDMIKAAQNAGKNQLETAAKQYGMTLQQLEAIASQVGITLYDKAGKLIPKAMDQLNEAIRLTIESITKWSNSLDDIKTQQNAYNKLYDVPDTPSRNLGDTYAVLMKMAPELMKMMGMANLNLDTEAGRNVLLNGLKDVFQLIASGKLTPELLGAFTDKNQLIEAILAAKDGLDAFRQSLGNVTTDFPKAIDLILFEQRRGTGTGSRPAAPPPKPTDVGTGGQSPISGYGGLTVHGDIIVQTSGDETGEEALTKIERAAYERSSRGGFVFIPNIRSSQ